MASIYIDSEAMYERDAQRRVMARANWLEAEIVALEDGAWLVLADQLISEHIQSNCAGCYQLSNYRIAGGKSCLGG